VFTMAQRHVEKVVSGQWLVVSKTGSVTWC
jgi:hypothetical protein